VFDPTCTNSIPGIQGIGYAPGYKEGLTYQARMVAERTAFDACVQVEVTYAVYDVPGIHAVVVTTPVMFTPLGATLAATAHQLDVWLP
jgi:hypothetical protein